MNNTIMVNICEKAIQIIELYLRIVKMDFVAIKRWHKSFYTFKNQYSYDLKFKPL